MFSATFAGSRATRSSRITSLTCAVALRPYPPPHYTPRPTRPARLEQARVPQSTLSLTCEQLEPVGDLQFPLVSTFYHQPVIGQSVLIPGGQFSTGSPHSVGDPSTVIALPEGRVVSVYKPHGLNIPGSLSSVWVP
ncbi:hypothetical protein J6590_047536 [Homalodisca vitripennis]|nr:hypothetical protein J6590_047536 [Homalodisca vitripennis]